jgi:endoglucanase
MFICKANYIEIKYYREVRYKMKKKLFKKRSTMSVLLVLVIVMSTLLTVNPLEAAGPVKVTGYIKPDTAFSTDVGPIVKAGFNVQLAGTSHTAVTDSNGYFEIPNIISGASYTIRISKTGYLARETTNFTINSDIRLSTQNAPVLMWCGDMNQDGAINMSDIMEIATSFNTSSGSANYNVNSDFNRDNAVNMSDIMAAANSFNKVTSNYPTIFFEAAPTPTQFVPTATIPVTSPMPTLPAGNYQVNSKVRVNSIGFLPDNDKKATIVATSPSFYIVNEASGQVVFYGTTTSMTNSDTNERVAIADFTSLKTPGTYYIAVPNLGKSVSFRIATDVYNETFKTSMLAMYLWRCNTAVSATYKGDTFSHEACHMNDGYLDSITGQHVKKDGTKGWHDAGDYNKYVVNAGITVGSMLFAWEQFQNKFKNMKLTMPENSNSLPDYLDEIKYETDWLLTMQYPDGSGKVSHKLTTKAFGDFILPEFETADRFFTPFGTAATADFVAMCAKASRAFKPYDAAYAEKLLNAAKVSYAYLKANPGDQPANLSGYSTGGYGTTDPDDRLWAAAEMWETTGESTYLNDFESRANSVATKIDVDFDWGNVNNLGMYTYLLSERSGKNQNLYNTIKNALTSAANSIVSSGNSSGYGRPLVKYYWCCNGTVARQTMTLMIANQLSPNPAYVNTSLDALGHLLGRNYYGRSYITGVGVNPPMNPHDRRSGGDSINNPWPGYLVGGGQTATNWVDLEESYQTNEIAINWNGALIYALASFVDPSK